MEMEVTPGTAKSKRRLLRRRLLMIAEVEEEGEVLSSSASSLFSSSFFFFASASASACSAASFANASTKPPRQQSTCSGTPRLDVSRAIPSTSSTTPCGNEGADATTSAVLRVRCRRTSPAVRRGATAVEELELELEEGFTTFTRIPK